MQNIPVTPAIRQLRASGIIFSLHSYHYEEKGGTSTAAAAIKVDEHAVIKTLIMEDDIQKPLIVLMHGDKQVSTKMLAREIGVKKVQPCTPQKAHKLTGYRVGGISPFGIPSPIRIYLESSIMELPKIYINAGKRGVLFSITPQELSGILNPVLVQVGF